MSATATRGRVGRIGTPPTERPNLTKTTSLERWQSLQRVLSGLDRVTSGQWDSLITTWNSLSAGDRREIVAGCRHGHLWARLPMGRGDAGSFVCVRCVSYDWSDS